MSGALGRRLPTGPFWEVLGYTAVVEKQRLVLTSNPLGRFVETDPDIVSPLPRSCGLKKSPGPGCGGVPGPISA